MLKKGDVVVVGVSGGPDSMALLHLLYTLKDEYCLKIHAAHLNHMLRGMEADLDTEYVKNFCIKFNIPYSIKYADINSMAEKDGLSTEEAGRRERYIFFCDIAKKIGANKIALAHNMNDQAETILMRMIRGAGLDGLCGIKPVRDMLYIRPLLFTMREDIEKYCRENDIAPRIDRTNFVPVYTRNKIRLELIPYIKKNFNKRIELSLSNTASLVSEDNDFINEYSDGIFEKIAYIKNHRVDININDIRNLHDSIKKRIIRRAIFSVKGDLNEIENKHIELILSIIKQGATGGAVELPGDIKAIISYEILCIDKSGNGSIRPFCYDMSVPGVTKIPEIGGEIRAEIIGSDIDYKKADSFVKYFDYDKIKYKLYVRSRHDGDCIVPLGMRYKKKLKEIFIDSKIPRNERNKVPLISCGREILWAVGLKMSDSFKIDENTRRVLKLAYKRLGV